MFNKILTALNYDRWEATFHIDRKHMELYAYDMTEAVTFAKILKRVFNALILDDSITEFHYKAFTAYIDDVTIEVIVL